jgi:hypothetical protein
LQLIFLNPLTSAVKSNEKLVNQKLCNTTKKCILPVSFPVAKAVINPLERKLAKRTSDLILDAF